jgi:hypothetical protein
MMSNYQVLQVNYLSSTISSSNSLPADPGFSRSGKLVIILASAPQADWFLMSAVSRALKKYELSGLGASSTAGGEFQSTYKTLERFNPLN